MIHRACLLSTVFVASLVFSASESFGRTWRDGLEGSVDRLGSVMKYRYFLPAGYDPSQEYPLLLFLHGSGESGTDNVRQVSNHIRVMIDKTEAEFPAVLVAPQLPRARGWSVANQEDLTTTVLEEVLTDYSVDLNRLYMTGLSMGGFGTMHYLQVFNGINPDILQFAAAAPIAGAFVDDRLAIAPLDVPVWLAHGDRDTAVDVSASRETFNLIAGFERDAPIDFSSGNVGAGGPLVEVGNVRYTEYPRVGHNSWSRFYASQDVYEWMFAQSLTIPEPTSAGLLMIAVPIALLRLGRGRTP